MKIVGINGSYRGNKGQTSAFLDLLFYGAEVGGAQCEAVHLAQYKINRCLGCNTCHTPEHYLSCLYAEKDDTAALFKKISEADLVIYATPVYVFGISSLLKTFIDRFYCTSDVYRMRITDSGLLFHHVDESICSKPFVSLVCCDNLDEHTPQNARDYFRVFSKFMDAPQKGEILRNGLIFFGKVKELEVNASLPKTGQVYDAFQQAGYELAINGSIRAKTQRKASQEVIPMPFFGTLKKFKFFKYAMLQHGNDFMNYMKK